MSDERTCRTCACVFKIEKPRIMPAGANKQEWDAMPAEMWVCRLDPPFLSPTPNGAVLGQRPTNPESVCWHYRLPGTLPGDDNDKYCSAEFVDATNRKHVCNRARGHGGLHAGDGASW